MARLAAGLVVALGLVGCVQGQPAGPSDAQKDAARGAYFECLNANAGNVDDGRSDASTVATALIGTCNGAFGDWAALITASMQPAFKMMFLENVRPRQYEWATSAVLQQRVASSRANGPQPVTSARRGELVNHCVKSVTIGTNVNSLCNCFVDRSVASLPADVVDGIDKAGGNRDRIVSAISPVINSCEKDIAAGSYR